MDGWVLACCGAWDGWMDGWERDVVILFCGGTGRSGGSGRSGGEAEFCVAALHGTGRRDVVK